MGIVLSRLLPYLLTGLAAFGAGMILGHSFGKAESHELGQKFVRYAFFEAAEYRTDKAALMSQIGQERARTREILERFEGIAEVTGEARAAMLADIRRTKRQMQELERESAAQLEALARELSNDAEQWKRGRVPDAVVCGVFDGAGCADSGVAGAEAGTGGDVEIREPAAEDGQ